MVSRLAQGSVSDTERTVARANALLERYGIVAREHARHESTEGGYGPVYKVLRAMEEAGRIRRGYFVEGLGGAQFGHVGAIDRLRAYRDDDEPWTEEDVRILATVDPANPWGSLLPWPATGNDNQGRPRRIPNTWTVLLRGHPALYVSARGSQLLTFPETLALGDDVTDLAFAALHRIPRGRRRRSHTFQQIDGVAIEESGHYHRLIALGFERDYRGLSSAAVS